MLTWTVVFALVYPDVYGNMALGTLTYKQQHGPCVPPSVILASGLATSTAVLCLPVYTSFTGGIYKLLYLNALEFSTWAHFPVPLSTQDWQVEIKLLLYTPQNKNWVDFSADRVGAKQKSGQYYRCHCPTCYYNYSHINNFETNSTPYFPYFLSNLRDNNIIYIDCVSYIEGAIKHCQRWTRHLMM